MEQALLSGAAVGSAYVLMTLGFALALGIADIVNAAHGAFVVGGMYIVLELESAGIPIYVAVVAAAALLAIAALPLYYYLIASAKAEVGHGAQLVYTLLLLSGLTALYQLIFGADIRTLNTSYGNVHLFGGTLSVVQLVSILLAVLAGAALYFASRYTYLGKMCHVAGSYPLGARSIGVPITRVYTSIFVLSAALAGLAGGLVVTFQSVEPTLGLDFLVVAIVVALAARMSIVMTVILGFLYGVVQAALNYAMPGVIAAMAPLTMFILVIVAQRRFSGNVFQSLAGIRRRGAAA